MSTPSPSEWRTLFRIAVGIISQVNSKDPIVESWTFGGGTAMMVQIQHRESHDVDIFIDDPQILPFLNPETQELACEIVPSSYSGDASRFLKIAFENIGEIDFIVSPFLTDRPYTIQEIEGVQTKLETIGEIITKKLHYRGKSLKPRDIFDIAAAASLNRKEVLSALHGHQSAVTDALVTLRKLKPEFVDLAIGNLAILEGFRDVAVNAREIATETLSASQVK
jgi:hypothetical protein